MAAPPSPVPPSTGQKLIAEALGTAFLVYVGAGSAAAYVGIARVRADAALTHLSPDLPGEESSPEPTVSGVTS